MHRIFHFTLERMISYDQRNQAQLPAPSLKHNGELAQEQKFACEPLEARGYIWEMLDHLDSNETNRVLILSLFFSTMWFRTNHGRQATIIAWWTQHRAVFIAMLYHHSGCARGRIVENTFIMLFLNYLNFRFYVEVKLTPPIVYLTDLGFTFSGLWS